MASKFPPKKNTAFDFYVSLASQADTKLFQANPTLAIGDVKVAVDDAAPANITSLPVVDADFTDRVKVSLSSAEMNGDEITVIFSDAAGAEWCDLAVNIYTAAQTLDEIDTLIDAIKAVTDNLPNSGSLTNLDAAVSSRSSHSAADVWTAVTRTLTANTNLNDISAADVNAQVLDVLNTDTFAEPTNVPAATASLVAKIGWMAKLARNKVAQTATQQSLYADDASTVDNTSALSDDGTTATAGEWADSA